MARKTYGSWATTAGPDGKLSWTAADGKTVRQIDLVLASAMDASQFAALTPQAVWLMSYGAKQKCVDSLSAGADTLAEYITKLDGRISSIHAGEFLTGGHPYLAEAIARLKKVPVEKAREAISAASVEQRDAWYRQKDVALMVTIIKSEAATASATAALASAGGDDGLPDFGKK